jgi:CRP-like cAMP-binding protein
MDPAIAQKIDTYFSQYPKREYPKGQILVFAGEEPEHVYYTVSGKIRMYAMSYRGDEVIVNIFKHPAFFPMSWALNNTPNAYFYKTEETTVLRVIPRADAVAFLEQNPDVALDLLRRVYNGMDGLLGRVVHLMSRSAKNRLLYELIIECARFGVEQPDGGYQLTVNESDLAARSGMSRETVSREFSKLKDQGWVTAAGKGIVVRDLAALHTAHGPEV